MLRAIAVYELFEGGRLVETELDEFVLRFYEQEEIASLLSSAGFTEVRVTAAYQDGDPSEDARALSVRCRRPD